LTQLGHPDYFKTVSYRGNSGGAGGDGADGIGFLLMDGSLATNRGDLQWHRKLGRQLGLQLFQQQPAV